MAREQLTFDIDGQRTYTFDLYSLDEIENLTVSNVVYAFCIVYDFSINVDVLYVGETTRELKARLYEHWTDDDDKLRQSVEKDGVNYIAVYPLNKWLAPRIVERDILENYYGEDNLPKYNHEL